MGPLEETVVDNTDLPMKTVTSVSGGQSSAYIAANYPSDFLVFALVCIEDRACTPKDDKLVQMVSDRIGREFIATAEDDTILHTMFDLEQYLGQRIDWVVGPTFDELIRSKSSWMPNPMQRYCTVDMKMKPMFEWWRNHCNIGDGEIVKQQIGFRAGEERRAKTMLERCDNEGVLSMRAVIGQHASGRNKWAEVKYQKPFFPLIENGIRKDKINQFWNNKPVRFAERNNCVGCFHRNPILLRQMFDKHPQKMEWFANIEAEGFESRPQTGQRLQGTFRNDMTYGQIAKHRLQYELGFDDFSECDSGHCGL